MAILSGALGVKDWAALPAPPLPAEVWNGSLALVPEPAVGVDTVGGVGVGKDESEEPAIGVGVGFLGAAEDRPNVNEGPGLDAADADAPAEVGSPGLSGSFAEEGEPEESDDPEPEPELAPESWAKPTESGDCRKTE